MATIPAVRLCHTPWEGLYHTLYRIDRQYISLSQFITSFIERINWNVTYVESQSQSHESCITSLQRNESDFAVGVPLQDYGSLIQIHNIITSE